MTVSVSDIDAAPIAKHLPFDRHEFEGRLHRLRARLSDQRLDVLLVHTPENMYYLSGYQTPG